MAVKSTIMSLSEFVARCDIKGIKYVMICQRNFSYSDLDIIKLYRFTVCTIRVADQNSYQVLNMYYYHVVAVEDLIDLFGADKIEKGEIRYDIHEVEVFQHINKISIMFSFAGSIKSVTSQKLTFEFLDDNNHFIVEKYNSKEVTERYFNCLRSQSCIRL